MEQNTFGFMRRGGVRRGAGRKRKGPKSRVSHRKRESFPSRYPIHVTMPLKEGLPTLRRGNPYRVLLESFHAGSKRFGFRLLEYTVQSNHLHLVVEAKDKRALSRGMQGLSVRIARGLNKLWGRRGKVFADRYHAEILKTPRRVRNVLVYVLMNARRHGIVLGERVVDPFSSGTWFEGWKEKVISHLPPLPDFLPHAESWLLRVGWRKQGLLSIHAKPAKA